MIDWTCHLAFAMQSFVILVALAIARFPLTTRGDSSCTACLLDCASPVMNATRLHLSSPPYENYFYSDRKSASQVVVTSPLAGSDPNLVRPRLLIAWPAGNSGVAAFFDPQDTAAGSLSLALHNSSTGTWLDGVYKASPNSSAAPVVGVRGYLSFNTSATMNLAILGSIRAIRDYTEGGSTLHSTMQDAVRFLDFGNGSIGVSRLWFDNITTSTLCFRSISDGVVAKITGKAVNFPAGTYAFAASFNYPQLEQFEVESLFATTAQDLQKDFPTQAASLSFLAYTDKLLAGGWKFLTYFGRDSMISLLLLQHALSGRAIQAAIGAVLERVNRDTGSAAHEETIGDYATLMNMQEGVTPSTWPQYDYKMVDTDFFLPIALTSYLLNSSDATTFLAKPAGLSNPYNRGLTYGDLALLNAERVMNAAAPFTQPGGQVASNLIHLKQGYSVGQWRDSPAGLGGGRVPYDVNTALVPAALRAISALAGAGLFPSRPQWAAEASAAAKIWEDNTLKFFRVDLAGTEARALVEKYVGRNRFPFPSHSDAINDEEGVTIYGLALEDNSGATPVRVMNTDDCMRLFLVNSTDDGQLSSFLSQVATHILTPFPAGLATEAGLVVANPAFAPPETSYSEQFGNTAYHGTVVWSWQLAMMAAGLERQLGRCATNTTNQPAYCRVDEVHTKVVAAYNRLWDIIEANRAQLSSEVWSWRWDGQKFVAEELGGVSATESDIVQLWSLTFLAVRRNESLR